MNHCKSDYVSYEQIEIYRSEEELPEGSVQIVDLVLIDTELHFIIKANSQPGIVLIRNPADFHQLKRLNLSNCVGCFSPLAV